MIDRASTRRSDEQLTWMLYETADWTLLGVNRVIVGEVASLVQAINLAIDCRAVGRRVVALARKGDRQIIVFADQFLRLGAQLPMAKVRHVTSRRRAARSGT